MPSPVHVSHWLVSFHLFLWTICILKLKAKSSHRKEDIAHVRSDKNVEVVVVWLCLWGLHSHRLGVDSSSDVLPFWFDYAGYLTQPYLYFNVPSEGGGPQAASDHWPWFWFAALHFLYDHYLELSQLSGASALKSLSYYCKLSHEEGVWVIYV